VPAIVAAQCAGAVAAAVLIRAAVGGAVTGAATVLTVTPLAGFGLEAVFSLALMLVILGSDGRDAEGGSLMIGLTVGFCALMGGPLTGASMNPARSLGPAIAGGIWTSHWLYWLAPITGTLAAVELHRILRLRPAAGKPEAPNRGTPPLPIRNTTVT
jgi:aquaporin Z